MNSCTRCDYECFIIGGCNFNNFNTTTEDFYERIKNGGYISNYDCGVDLKISNSNGYSAQITTIENELNNLKENINNHIGIQEGKIHTFVHHQMYLTHNMFHNIDGII